MWGCGWRGKGFIDGRTFLATAYVLSFFLSFLPFFLGVGRCLVDRHYSSGVLLNRGLFPNRLPFERQRLYWLKVSIYSDDPHTCTLYMRLAKINSAVHLLYICNFKLSRREDEHSPGPSGQKES